MPSPSSIALFLTASLVLLLIPGPAVLYIVARGINQGRSAGLMSALGTGAGNAVHVAAATLGLSALLLSSALAFSAVRYAGAAYLIALGIRTLLTRDNAHDAAVLAPKRLSSIFYQGVIVNVLNPKVALFFFAFLPQFIDPNGGAVAGQTAFFGCLFVLLGICTDSAYAVVSGTLGGLLKGNLRFLRGQRLFAGTVYIGLGLTTALSGSGKK
jgi:threonine/homoserine/homoserine lactone efflux protein